MKKILMIFGGIFIFLVIAGVISFSVLAIKGSTLDKESKAYVDEVTPKILANLNKENLFQYASIELKNAAPPEEFDKIFNLFAKLGQFKEYKDAIGESNISLTTERGKQITGVYKAQAEFEKRTSNNKYNCHKERE